MRKKDILELKRRLKKDYCTFTKLCGCYVSGEKHIISTFRETFLNLEEEEYFKYLEIAKKVMSGTLGNNILELNFPLGEDLKNEKQYFLLELKSSQLKNDALLEEFYRTIIDNYSYTGNFLILLYHDAYDVITKTKDDLKLDESEEVYEYILCAICPVSLSAPGLSYFDDDNKIKARIRDWVVEVPANGFIYPAFINRSSDVNAVMYYTKNPKDPHPELMEDALGCYSRQTAAIQKQAFQEIVKESFADEEKAEKIFIEIQDNLNAMVEEHNSTYEDVESAEPITLSEKEIQNLLLESGVPEEVTSKIERSYGELFEGDLPMAESLIDARALKLSEQRKKEKYLEKQVEILQYKLEQVKQEAAVDNQENATDEEIPEELDQDNVDIEEANDIEAEDNTQYDVVLQVKPEKISQIKTEIIDGQKCIVIPIEEDEQAKVNGREDII
ncbi:DUF4317 domain-containing protein [Alloiococcus sp. CFN-8]|uniref:DUF4317 domain-containing protein n=1 Tax=Alloiococcus sp. CFN-8 TaxID=3416081 RepID=UPI003CF847C0